MKRSLCMLLAGLLVLVMASPLYAQPDIKVFGQIRTRLRYWVNIDLDDTNASSTTAAAGDRRYFDTRTRLGVDAKLAEGVRAVIELEKYFDFGSIQPNAATSAGVDPLLNRPGQTDQSPYFRQAWIDFVVPGLQEYGTRIQAGRSFFRVGNGFVWGDSLTGEDGFTLYGPLGPGNFKARFSQTTNQNTTVLGAPAPATRARFFDNEVNNFMLDYKFPVVEKQNLELYFIGQYDRAVDNFSTLLSTATVAGATSPVRHGENYWVGAAYDGVAGPIALKAEGVYQFGKTRKDVAFDTGTGLPCTVAAATCTRVDDISRQAFFLYGEGRYKIIPAWDVAMAVTFSSGHSGSAGDTYYNFVAPLSEWTTSMSNIFSDSQFYYGNRTARAIGSAVTSRLYNYWGRGTMDVDVLGGASTADDLSLYSPGLFELEFKTKYAFNPQVTGNLAVIPMWAHRSPGGSGQYMGTGIDATVGYKPYANLLINGYISYFVAGGFFNQGGALLAGQPRQATDNPWMFRAEALVTF